MYNDDIPFLGRDSGREDDRDYGRTVPAPEEDDEEMTGRARIKVIGVGGGGNNAVNRMIDAGITSAEYVAVNTDMQTLALNKAEVKVQIGRKLTKGLGAGSDPEIGRLAAEESKDELVKAIEKTDLLFITAGMGGGTGTGAAPVIAKIAKDLKILTVAVVTEPFVFEGRRRMDNTMKGLENLRKYVDTIIIIPNEKIGDVIPKNTSMDEALRVADEVLKQGIRGLADLIVTPSLINLDFADVRTILKGKGLAHMGVGVAKGENRIVEAVRLAVTCPLLETTIEGATGVIINIVGGNDLTFDEVKLANTLIHSVVDYSANIIFGAGIDENIRDEVEVTVIATGFHGDKPHSAPAPAESALPASYRPAPAQPYSPQPRPYRPQGVQQSDNFQQPGVRQPGNFQQPRRPVQPGGASQPVRRDPYGDAYREVFDRPAPEENGYGGYPQGEYSQNGYPQNGDRGGYPNGYPNREQPNGWNDPRAQAEHPAEERTAERGNTEMPEAAPRDQQLPDFVRRLIGKKRNN